MKDVTYGNLQQKYEKKKNYLVHYELLELLSGGGYMYKINFFMLLGFYLFWREYPLPLATLDFAFTVLTVLFYLFLKPRLLQGKVKGYYRRSYKDMKLTSRLIHFFIVGGIQRFIIMALYYGLTLYLVRDDAREVERYQEIILDIVVNPLMWLLAIGLFALVLYQLLYREKYATIREFSNGVMEMYAKYSYNEVGAVNEFIARHDKKHKLFDVDGVKYDGHMRKQKPVETTPSQPNETAHTEPETVVHVVEEEIQQMVRRKARK